MSDITQFMNTQSPLLIYDFFDMDLAMTMAMESPNGAWMKQFSSSTTSAAEKTLLVSQMATLPSDESVAAVCSVCMDGFDEEGSGKITRCGHMYHGNCIIEWLSQKDSCPICRCKISGDGEN
ncbi:E3 ubiquitin-protein ligase RNF181-like [Impatiens glandulifera]|uniref:E3 ubiquitin-protein ligase RNF181-like n=1 Tax=Impatiens glandulifera TaxID=253017 RepID=UPI001FB1846F|nr:E3 ubiquitin-protein ligase RNF181-like [Impatiens glandulifera]